MKGYSPFSGLRGCEYNGRQWKTWCNHHHLQVVAYWQLESEMLLLLQFAWGDLEIVHQTLACLLP